MLFEDQRLVGRSVVKMKRKIFGRLSVLPSVGRMDGIASNCPVTFEGS
jgi:hypothetical protein